MLILLWKNIQLSKKQFITCSIQLLVLIPLILNISQSDNMGTKILKESLLYLISSFLLIYMVDNAVAIADTENPRVTSFLCALPFSRRKIVLESYVRDFLLLSIVFVAYAIESAIFDEVNMPSLEWILFSVLIIVIYRGVLIPLEYRFGYAKTKFITLATMMIIAIGIPFISNFTDIYSIDIRWFTNLSDIVKIIILLSAAVCIEMISIMVSCHIFLKKDL